MSVVGKVAKLPREKTAKVYASSQNGRPDAPPTNKNQPTAEQMRLAQIVSDRTEGDPEIALKVAQITDLTGRSNDEAMTALYDCDYDVNRTVEKLLESQEASVDEWQVIDKKKKPPVASKGSPSDIPPEFKFENQMEPDMELNHNDGGAPRGRGGRGAMRLPRGRGRATWSDRTDRTRENTGHEREGGFENNRGRRRGNFGDVRGRGGHRGARSMHSNKFETEIDTWTNESTPNGGGGGGNDSRIGSWTEVADEWTADEWNGSLNESCVFTPSASSRSANVYPVPNDASNGKPAPPGHQSMTMTVESSNVPDQGALASGGGDTVGDAPFSSLHPQQQQQGKMSSLPGQDSIGQQYVVKETVNEMANCYGNNMSDRTMYVSHYNKEATECIKSVMGIGQNLPTVDEMGQAAGHQPQVSLQQQQQQQQSSSHIQRVRQTRPRLPPPSKIPSMPVEMPDSMNSGRLDVQFGSWDAVPPAAAASSISFMSDIIPSSEFARSTMISSSQASTASSASATTQSAASPFDAAISESQMTADGHSTSAPKPAAAASFPSSLATANQANEALHHMMVSMSGSSGGLLTSVTKATGSPSSQLGFNQMAYSSPGDGGVSASGPKLMSNGPSHYGSSFGYHAGASSLGAAMSSDYSLSPEQVQYTYGESQRYGAGANGPQTPQPGSFGPTPLPPGYSSGPLPSQQPALHYGGSQGPTKLFVSEKQGTGTYSMGTDVSGLYAADKQQGTSFPGGLSQSYDSSAAYQAAAGGFPSVGGGSQSNGMYPGVASGLGFQGMQMDSTGFDAGQYAAVYRQKDVPSGYEVAATTGAGFSAIQGQTSQTFSSGYGPAGQGQAAQSASGSSFIGQSVPQTTGHAFGSQALGAPSGGSNGPQRQSGVSQSYGGQVDAGAQSATQPGLVSSAAGKVSDGVSKLNLKDAQQQQVESADAMSSSSTSVDGAGNAVSGGATTSAGAVASAATVAMALAPKTPLTAAAKSSMSQTNKPMPSMPPGMPSGAAAATAAMLNHNYMISSQPPGFQMAAYGYPTAQQPLTYQAYEEFQMMQQRFTNPLQYYDMALQSSAALGGRDPAGGPLGAQSYAGNDMKLASMDVLSPVNAQANQQQQQQQLTASQQQAFINHNLHPTAYSYFYPGTGLVPHYYPAIVPMNALPSVSNPALAGTTSTTQYQKQAMFGSHAGYTMGGQAQDFSKTFGGSQVPSKPGVATGMGAAASGDLMAGAGGFGKTQHIQTYDRGGYHGSTPPPYSMALPGSTQAAGGALGAAAVYGPQYVPLVQHQQSHSQLLHHAVPQDSAVAGRVAPPSAVQQKMGGNKGYNTTAYWGTN